MIPKTIVDLDEVSYHPLQLGKTDIILKPEPVILQKILNQDSIQELSSGI